MWKLCAENCVEEAVCGSCVGGAVFHSCLASLIHSWKCSICHSVACSSDCLAEAILQSSQTLLVSLHPPLTRGAVCAHVQCG